MGDYFDGLNDISARCSMEFLKIEFYRYGNDKHDDIIKSIDTITKRVIDGVTEFADWNNYLERLFDIKTKYFNKSNIEFIKNNIQSIVKTLIIIDKIQKYNILKIYNFYLENNIETNEIKDELLKFIHSLKITDKINEYPKCGYYYYSDYFYDIYFKSYSSYDPKLFELIFINIEDTIILNDDIVNIGIRLNSKIIYNLIKKNKYKLSDVNIVNIYLFYDKDYEKLIDSSLIDIEIIKNLFNKLNNCKNLYTFFSTFILINNKIYCNKYDGIKYHQNSCRNYILNIINNSILNLLEILFNDKIDINELQKIKILETLADLKLDYEINVSKPLNKIANLLINNGYSINEETLKYLIKYKVELDCIDKNLYKFKDDFLEECKKYNFYPYGLSLEVSLESLYHECGNGTLQNIKKICKKIKPDKKCLEIITSLSRFKDKKKTVEFFLKQGVKPNINCILNILSTKKTDTTDDLIINTFTELLNKDNKKIDKIMDTHT